MRYNIPMKTIPRTTPAAPANPAGKSRPAIRRAAVLLLCLLCLFSQAGCAVQDIPGVRQLESFFITLNEEFGQLFGDERLIFQGGDPDGGSTNGGGYTNGPSGNRLPSHGDTEKTDRGLSGGVREGTDEGWQNNLSPQGSARFLQDNVVLVSIYLIDGSSRFTKEEIAYTRDAIDIAAGWMEDKAAEHGVPLNVICNEQDLTFRFTADGMLEESRKEISFKYTNTIGDYLYHFDLDAIKEEYNTDSVGFIIFLPGEGTSFAYPYTATGSRTRDAVGYYEFANLYMYDESAPNEYENPATYAHEILHLFGACDLYQENETDHISEELYLYIESNYPDEIMYYTYENDNTSNFEEITKDMSPATLYFIGWGDGGEEIGEFPKIKRKYPCSFE